MTPPRLFVALLVLLGPGFTAARAAHVDILAYNDTGQIGTGYVDVDSGDTVTGARLFTETFNIVQPTLFGATAPGFYSNSEYPLLPTSDLAFNALAITHPFTQTAFNLLYWDGQGNVNFTAPAIGDTLQLRLSSSTNITLNGDANDVPGFVIDTTGPDGILHKHISYAARNDTGDPADGFYLVSIQLTMPGLADSNTVYLLFNAHYQRDAQNNILYLGDTPLVHEDSQAQAEEWIEQYLLGTSLPGDLNADGFVGLGDLDIVLGHWNQSVPAGDRLQGDASGDGFVGLADLDGVLGHWNTGTPPTDLAPIPEPGSLSLLAGTTAVMASRRKRR